MVQIRPATLDDLCQVRDISVHYVRHSRLTFLQNPGSQAMFIKKFLEITNSRQLPYLVAVEQQAPDNQEMVVGYSYLSPFRGHMLSYAPTVELTLFVHPEYQSRAIGTRLLTTILERAEAPEVVHRAREVVADDDGVERTIYADGGSGVRIRNILAVMAIDINGKDDGEALRRWYIQRGFEEMGRMKNVGFKMDRWIDTVYLQYTLPE
jgi:L-amino acid N-acyltransferase YncA